LSATVPLGVRTAEDNISVAAELDVVVAAKDHDVFGGVLTVDTSTFAQIET